jgi:phosphosulfolactate synthase
MLVGFAPYTGGGPFEVAATFGVLPDFMDLCADIGVNRIEAGEGFTEQDLDPHAIVAMAAARGLDVQYEAGKKHGGTFTKDVVEALVIEGQRWLDAGAKVIIIEGRESAQDVGLFDHSGKVNAKFAERFVEAWGIDRVCFEAPNKPSQFALLNHFGPIVHMSNVRLEELLRVELYRRGLICRTDDRGDPVVQLAPPLIADTEQFEEIVDVLRPVLEEASRRIGH